MDRKHKFVEFPNILNQIEADDAQFELSVSNSVQRCRLYDRESNIKPFYDNTVNKAIGVIVVNTMSKDCEYEPDVEVNETETIIQKQISETREFFESLQISDENITLL